MCKFCEFNEKLDRRNSNLYAEYNGAFVIYKTVDDKHILAAEVDIGSDDFYPWVNILIEYCPYCGRKLSEE